MTEYDEYYDLANKIIEGLAAIDARDNSYLAYYLNDSTGRGPLRLAEVLRNENVQHFNLKEVSMPSVSDEKGPA